MAEIIDVSNWLFRVKEVTINSDDKIKFGWIFNRFLAKKYPAQAQLLNHKRQDLSIILDLWREFLKGSPYPKWLWSKTEKERVNLTKEEVFYLCKVWDLNPRDIQFLEDRFPREIEEEIKYWKKQQKLK
jgi:hypothetical protein